LSPKGTSHTNTDSEWGNESLIQKFHRTINMMALLATILGSRNKKTNSKISKKKNNKGTPLRIPTKKDSNLCFIKKITPLNKSDGTFGNSIWIQEQNKLTQNFEI
jgi:hypothetical protein